MISKNWVVNSGNFYSHMVYWFSWLIHKKVRFSIFKIILLENTKNQSRFSNIFQFFSANAQIKHKTEDYIETNFYEKCCEWRAKLAAHLKILKVNLYLKKILFWTPLGKLWPLLDPFRHLLTHLDPLGPLWTPLDLFGPLWIPLYPFGPHFDPFWHPFNPF